MAVLPQKAPTDHQEKPEQLSLASAQRAVKGHMPALDGIRGIAVILVMVCHFSRILSPDNLSRLIFSNVTEAGWVGVDLFFVLSGFLITGILLDSKSSASYFSSFYMRRILRIFPLYYAACFVYLVVVPFLQSHARVMTGVHTVGSDQIWFWTYAVNWGQAITHRPFNALVHFWSLAIEEQFYLLWPLAVRITSRRGLGRLCVGLVLISQLLRIVLLLQGFTLFTIFQITVTRLDGLALGALAALAVRDEVWLKQAASLLKYLIPIPFVWLVVLGLVSGQFSQINGPLVIIFSPLLLAVMFAGILLSAILRPGSHFESFLRAPWLRSCGKYSYAMYVFHVPLQSILEARTKSFFLRETMNTIPGFWRILVVVGYIIASSFLTYGIARISWWAMERHFINLKRYF
jgi:peptidoglycan/LPS O-acetylase OafA/YrhL